MAPGACRGVVFGGVIASTLGAPYVTPTLSTPGKIPKRPSKSEKIGGAPRNLSWALRIF